MLNEPITKTETKYTVVMQPFNGHPYYQWFDYMPVEWLIEHCKGALRNDHVEYARVLTEVKHYTTATLPSGQTVLFLLSTDMHTEDITLTPDEVLQRDERRRQKQRRKRRHWALSILAGAKVGTRPSTRTA